MQEHPFRPHKNVDKIKKLPNISQIVSAHTDVTEKIQFRGKDISLDYL